MMWMWIWIVLVVLFAVAFTCWYVYDGVFRLKRQRIELECTVDCQAEALGVLRAELKVLQTPALYNKPFGGEAKVPLGRLANKTIRECIRPGIANMVAISQDLLRNRKAAYDFTVIIETSEGNWCRTIEPEGVKKAEIDHEAIFVQLEWNKIYAGKPLTIEDAYIVHRGRHTRQYTDLVGRELASGDDLNLKYNFSG